MDNAFFKFQFSKDKTELTVSCSNNMTETITGLMKEMFEIEMYRAEITESKFRTNIHIISTPEKLSLLHEKIVGYHFKYDSQIQSN